MPTLLSNFFHIGLALSASFLVFLTPTRAEETSSFTAQLDSADRTAAGLHRFTIAQLGALDTQVARELTVARQGDVVAFSRSFLSRRTADQVTAAGLAALTPSERTALDTYIARAVAQRPAPVVTTLAAKAKVTDNVVETITYKPRLHGEVTLTVGTAGGGRNFYGGSFTTIYDDPQHRLTAAFTYAEYHGNGLLSSEDCAHPSRSLLLR
jgi:hypothetical protein